MALNDPATIGDCIPATEAGCARALRELLEDNPRSEAEAALVLARRTALEERIAELSAAAADELAASNLAARTSRSAEIWAAYFAGGLEQTAVDRLNHQRVKAGLAAYGPSDVFSEADLGAVQSWLA